MSFSIQFLGVGGAFAVPTDPPDMNTCLMQSNMVLTNHYGKKLLIDCGSYIPLSATTQGLSAADFDAVYISHEHADHAGGLEWLGLSTFFNPNAEKPKLFADPTVVSNLRAMTIPGLEVTTHGIQSFSDYFTVETEMDDDAFLWEGLRIWRVPTIHVEHPRHPLYSHGMVFRTNQNTVWITSDTVFDPNLIDLTFTDWQPDIIFQDCETTSFKTGVHAHYDDLKTLSPAIKQRMWLYHYDANSAAQLDAVADGFAGFVQRGQTFDL